jgi:hypothetical protein
MERPQDKVEKYIHLMCKKFGGEVVEARLSSYYNVNGRILRVSDHIGTNSSGNLSIIIPSYRTEKELYMLHAHPTGALSIVNYEELKNIIHSFFYMSSIFNTIIQPNFQMELEKKDKFEASEKTKALMDEVKRLKGIEKKCETLKTKIREANINLKETGAFIQQAQENAPGEPVQSQAPTIIIDSNESVLGVPRTFFEAGQLKVIAATAHKVATKYGLDVAKDLEKMKK